MWFENPSADANRVSEPDRNVQTSRRPPMCGVFTSAMSSERCGRRFRGIDIDPAYVDVAIDRWITMTGGTPELAKRSKAE